MGKRNLKLAGSVRRYVATGISRVTRGITGVLSAKSASNMKEREERDGEPLFLTASESDVEVLPVTKVPALDTVDAYAAGKQRPIEEDSDSVGFSQRITLSAGLDVRTMIDGLVRGYARFVMALTGLEEVAFHFSPSPEYHTVILASSQDGLKTREVRGSHNGDEVQFYLELGRPVTKQNVCQSLQRSS